MNYHSIKTLSAACCLLALTTGSHAADITWGLALNISGDTDVSTEGSSVFAASFDRVGGAGTVIAVNGVDFSGGGNSAGINDSSLYGTDLTYTFTGSSPNGFGFDGGTFADLSDNYKNILDSGGYADVGTHDLTLGNLEIDQTYQIQLWVNDARANTNRMMVGSTVVDFNTNDTAGTPGQYVFGSFTADAASQAFTMSTVTEDTAWALNAIQVRAVPEPSSYALLASCFALGAVVVRRRKA